MQVLCYAKKMDTCGGLNGTKFVAISLIWFFRIWNPFDSVVFFAIPFIAGLA
jgi:hypothetical protein